jgi:hypothetical protein
VLLAAISITTYACQANKLVKILSMSLSANRWCSKPQTHNWLSHPRTLSLSAAKGKNKYPPCLLGQQTNDHNNKSTCDAHSHLTDNAIPSGVEMRWCVRHLHPQIQRILSNKIYPRLREFGLRAPTERILLICLLKIDIRV